MRYVHIVVILLAAGGTWQPARAGNSADAVVKRLPEDARLVSDELQAALTERRLEFKDAAWPRDINVVRVDKARVPDAVLASTTRWLRTIIKTKYLPEHPNDWLIPIREPRPGFYKIDTALDGSVRRTLIPREGFDDYLVTRYAVGHQRFQIQENGASVRVVIDVNDPNLFSPKIEQFVSNVLYTFLNYPLEHKDKLRFALSSFEHGGRTIWFGVLDCNFSIADSEVRATRTWWNHTYMWTDGRRVYFSLVEMIGEHRTPGQAREGLPLRFK
ncbi:MAG: hypothetical protein JW993_02165 [Sedimentisphaerales bacterium]|nr:hypothetical protein [Sedimentisphaerales bacterium]